MSHSLIPPHHQKQQAACYIILKIQVLPKYVTRKCNWTTNLLGTLCKQSTSYTDKCITKQHNPRLVFWIRTSPGCWNKPPCKAWIFCFIHLPCCKLTVSFHPSVEFPTPSLSLLMPLLSQGVGIVNSSNEKMALVLLLYLTREDYAGSQASFLSDHTPLAWSYESTCLIR